MKDFLLYLVTCLADMPEAVVVSENLSPDGTTVLEISVAPEDMGKIIGKGGKVIKALRDLTRILAVKQNVRVMVALAEV